MVTPVLDEHRKDFEKIASRFLQSPITIKNVRVWYQYQPVFSHKRDYSGQSQRAGLSLSESRHSYSLAKSLAVETGH